MLPSIHVITHGDDKRRVGEFQQAVTAFIRTHTGYTVFPGGADSCHSLVVYGPDDDKLRDLYHQLALIAHFGGFKITSLVTK